MKKSRSFITSQLSKMIGKRGTNSPPRVNEMEDIQTSNGEMSVPIPTKGTKFDKKSFEDSDFELPYPPEKLRKKYGLFSQVQKGPKPTPVIVVTDIGADIDDTLALFVLLGAMDTVKIVAVVTSVNNGLHRGAVTRGFLRLLGVSDESVEILPSVDGCVADCYIPDSFPAAREAALGNPSHTPRRIVEICKEHLDTGVLLFGIASLTPIADAIRIDQKEQSVMTQCIKGIYLQGNCYISNGESQSSDSGKFLGQNVKIFPNPLAYNFKNDMNAANLVFETFQDLVPFTILGKFAAYKVPVRKGDFTDWTRRINATWKVTSTKMPPEVKVPNPTDLLLTAKRQMKRFRSMNPEKFDSIYNVPNDLSQHELEKFEWFDDLPNDFVCSHPYDPLLGLRMIDDIERKRLKGNGDPNKVQDVFLMKDDGSPKLFREYRVQNENGHTHVILGNIPSQHSIPNAEYVHDILVARISKGLSYHGDSIWLN